RSPPVNGPPRPSLPSARGWSDKKFRRKRPMPASQHTSPKTDIQIAQEAKKRPIMELAKDRLGIAAENLEPYGHYKAKLSMDFIKSLQGQPNRKLIPIRRGA